MKKDEYINENEGIQTPYELLIMHKAFRELTDTENKKTDGKERHNAKKD